MSPNECDYGTNYLRYPSYHCIYVCFNKAVSSAEYSVEW